MNYAQAIQHIYPEATVLEDFSVLEAKGETSIEWNYSQPQPTEEELQTAYTASVAIKAAEAYKANRAKEYPSIGDQLDVVFKALQNSDNPEVQPMIDEINAIKAKYPKS